MRRNKAAVVSLSVLLVLVTTFAVAGRRRRRGLGGLHVGFAPAVVLGAVVASTDPVAALSIARRVGMPERLSTLLAGEGLLNDATSLTLFGVGVSAVTGHATMLDATASFFAAAAGGAGIGLSVAWLVLRLRRLLPDSTSHGVLSLATPFLAYLPAAALHVSGVLALVICGLWMGHRAPVALPGRSRLELNATWRLIEVILQGFVFFIIGDQLSSTTSRVLTIPRLGIALAVAATIGAVLVARAIWLWASTTHGARRVRLSLGGPAQRPLRNNELVVLWWSGSRGVITLAAAYSIPHVVGSRPFPDRPLIVFCTCLLVLVTLLVQGTTLAPLARLVRLPADGTATRRRLAEARGAAVEAGLQRLEDVLREDPQPDDLVAPLRGRANLRRERSEDRLAALDAEHLEESRSEARRRLRANMIAAEREELLRWRDTGRLPTGTCGSSNESSTRGRCDEVGARPAAPDGRAGAPGRRGRALG